MKIGDIVRHKEIDNVYEIVDIKNNTAQVKTHNGNIYYYELSELKKEK